MKEGSKGMPAAEFEISRLQNLVAELEEDNQEDRNMSTFTYTDLPETAIAVFCDDDIIIYYDKPSGAIYVDEAPDRDPYRCSPATPAALRQLYRDGEALTREEMAIAYPDDYRKMTSGQCEEECTSEPTDDEIYIEDAIAAINLLSRYLGAK